MNENNTSKTTEEKLAKAEAKAAKKLAKAQAAENGSDEKVKKPKVKRVAVDELAQMARSDIRLSGLTMGAMEARYLVDAYYISQNGRIRSDAQVRSMEGEPTAVIQYLAGVAAITENTIKKTLDDYTLHHPVGAWLRTIVGIGPVTAAGLIAHLDVKKSETAGGFWKFAGLAGDKWEKGQKRPWNAELKKLVCFKVGESFVKTQNKEEGFYGKLYRERKDHETAKNEAGGFADIAAQILAQKKWDKSTPTYACMVQGKLSPAHIHARARRYAVKIFLSHLHEVMYLTEFGKPPPAPFAIAILNHAHRIHIPNPGSVKEWKEHVEITDDDFKDDIDN